MLTGLFVAVGPMIVIDTVFAAPEASFPQTIFEDQFNRDEKNEGKEDPGNGWGTNSKTRAKGEKQVFLRDDAMYVKRAAVADHGVSVTQDVSFQDARITARFMLPKQGDLGVNIADMSEPSGACRAYLHGPYKTSVA